jgi:hypothetical protein
VASLYVHAVAKAIDIVGLKLVHRTLYNRREMGPPGFDVQTSG